MKKRIILFLAVVAIVLTDCVKDLEKEEVRKMGVTVLKGRVVEGTNHTSLPNIRVLITNGSQTYGSTISNAEGNFVLEVDYSKIDETYYLLLDGGSDDIQKKEDLRGVSVGEYDYRDIVLYSLPSFQYGGHTYQVAPDPGNIMTWDVAKAYCNSLTLCNLSDWRMPTKEELLQMYVERNSIDGFSGYGYWSSSYGEAEGDVGYITGYYVVFFQYGDVRIWSPANTLYVRPIRKAN